MISESDSVFTKQDLKLFFGSPVTLIANLLALFLAFMLNAEGSHIVHECSGYYPLLDWPLYFAPVVAMFVIRNRVFSIAFLALHVALWMQMFVQAGSIHIDPNACGGRIDGPTDYIKPVFVISLLCLAVYLVVSAIGALIRAFSR
jgi:hypothetical protein